MKILRIRLNNIENIQLEAFKETINQKKSSTAYKIALTIAHNVLLRDIPQGFKVKIYREKHTNVEKNLPIEEDL